MSGSLPPGWEWDYDGARWLYRYKPNGHVQYHFPKAGDEFPDFVDTFAPIPDLAPEERLESQQQLKRQGSSGGTKAPKTSSPKAKNGWKSRMSATAQPFSSVWEDDLGGDDDGEVFQPESFMFLGPGTYNDVSPLMEEEDEAAKRSVVGVEKAGSKKLETPMVSENNTPMTQKSQATKKSISPMVSENNTPMTQKSQVTTGTTASAEQEIIIVGQSVFEAPLNEVPVEIMGNSVAPVANSNYQMYELPVETAVPLHHQNYDPVGFVAEMPTEHTASARVETHPDPVELAGHYMMAPIETEVPAGFVELPASTSPVEPKAAEEGRPTEAQLEQRRREVRQKQEERKREIQQKVDERKRREEEERLQYLKEDEARKQAELQQHQTVAQDAKPDPGYQPFKIQRKPTLREAKAKATTAISGGQVPGGYQPYVPGQQRGPQAEDLSSAHLRTASLQREASLMISLKPSNEAIPPSEPAGDVKQSQDGLAPAGVVKYPSVLRPARGRPGQQPELRDGSPKRPVPTASADEGRRDSQGSGYKPIAHGQHPASMTPAPAPPPPPPKIPATPPTESTPAAIERPTTTAPVVTSPPIQRPQTTAPALPSQQHPIRPHSVIGSHMVAPPEIPPKVAPQAPYPIDSHENAIPPPSRKPTAPYPVDEPHLPQSGSVIRGPPHGQQLVRPASAMPVLEHQRRGSAPSQIPSSPIGRGAPLPGSVIVPAGMAPRPASTRPIQPLQQIHQQRRQSFQPSGAPQPIGAAVLDSKQDRAQSIVYPLSSNFAGGSSSGPQQAETVRRHSSQDEVVSPIRPRSESTSSVFAMQTPSPMESRRGSANTPSSQNANGSSSFVPTPLSQSSNSQGRASAPPMGAMEPSPLNTPPRYPVQQQQKPTAAANPPYPGSDGSYFPPQGAPAQPKDKSKRHSMPAEQLANLMQQDRSGSPFSQANYQSGPPEEQPGEIKRSSSLRSSRQSAEIPQDNRPGQQGQLPSQDVTSPGHSLTRIDEREEPELLKFNIAPLRLGKRTSVPGAPNVPPATSNVPGRQQPPAQGPLSNIPPQQQGGVPQKIPQARPPQQQFLPSQVLEQPPAMQGRMTPPQNQTAPPPAQAPQQGQLPDPRAGAPQRPTFQSIPPQAQAPGALPPQGLQQTGRPPQQPPQQQPWNPQQHPNVPQSVPPLQTSAMSANNEKGKPWTKWFSGGTKPAQSPTTQKQPAFAPGGQQQQQQPPLQQPPMQGGGNQHPEGWQAGKPVGGPPVQQPLQPQQLQGIHQRPPIHQQDIPPASIPGRPSQGPPKPIVAPLQDNVPPARVPQASQGQNQRPAAANPPTAHFPGQPPANAQKVQPQGQQFASHAAPQSFTPPRTLTPVQSLGAPRPQAQQQVNSQSPPPQPLPPQGSVQPNRANIAAAKDLDVTAKVPEPKKQYANVSGIAGLPSQQQQSRPTNPQAALGKSKPSNGDFMKPLPLFSRESSLRNKPVGRPGVQLRDEGGVAPKQDKWASKPAVDYSGEDWGDDEFA